MPAYLLLFIFVALTSGCANNIKQDPVEAADILKPGSILELTQAVKIPAYTASIMIQSGTIQSDSSIDQYYPNCRLEMKRPVDTIRQLVPGPFVITKVVTETEFAQRLPVMVASISTIYASMYDQVYSTIIYLKSKKNPGIELLACEYWRDPSFATHLSMKQIKTTLDGIFIIN